jgi:hypothetical protein
MATKQLIRNDSQIEKAIGDAVDTLKWCRKHRNERRAIDTLRVVQANLSYLALALDWEMEGDETRANNALRKVWWEPLRELEEAPVVPMTSTC